MKEFRNKTAVVTGAASGIGRAIAKHCAGEGMNVVISDIEIESLRNTEEEIKATGASVLPVATDVSKLKDIEALAEKTIEKFGSVDLLFNNAGVVLHASTWENTISDWEWVLGVNLWAVIYGIKTFTPIMIKQGTPCHIVNTGSTGGITSNPGISAYNVSKHGVVTLSETLFYDLQAIESKVNVSVLCPGAVDTNLMNSNRNRRNRYTKPEIELTEEEKELKETRDRYLKDGMPPEKVAEEVFNAIRNEKFYILTHPDIKEFVRSRMEDILLERNPSGVDAV
ncbi:MAG: SDR family NAD(P)-dependent oxidoreductase [Desulfobacterales bacterium]|jgi:NAD(P)-dependent dehydrogenase (short-subunit alcohol dehydrogenase family)|nr:SDR family NAD(P)-dependent oxidoreductase [Desulfobacteraceae bacterium]MBT4363387.1 SDR family NAD(P)-dependent oxidoreductase [Desulfobacteraceae bacterium]MBT7085725.1 SDR family NAD(P)-dependent oxidoreductase [Desulfobacterales bacterium]MBT7698152.1 SDR family NAD(P)-dependent oxidoreductase [Desulfobacterales bacterium]